MQTTSQRRECVKFVRVKATRKVTFPSDDITTANGTPERAVLVSERTQLIYLKAIEQLEQREAWETVSDAKWDALHDAIGQAQAELLTETSSGLQKETYSVSRSQTNQGLLAALSPNSIIWDGGSFDPLNPTHVPMDEAGLYIFNVNFWAQCGNTIGWEVRLLINGAGVLMRDFNDAPHINFIPSVSWQVPSAGSEYIEVQIVHSQNATLRSSDLLNAVCWVTRFYEP